MITTLRSQSEQQRDGVAPASSSVVSGVAAMEQVPKLIENGASEALPAPEDLDSVKEVNSEMEEPRHVSLEVKQRIDARELPKTIEDLKLGTTDSATIKTDVKIKNVTSKHNSTKEEKSIGNLSSDLPLQGNLTASEFSNLSVVMTGDSHEKQKTSCDISVEEKEIIVASVALDSDDKLYPVMSTRNRLKKDLTYNFNVKAKRGDSVEEKQIIVASVARELPKTIEDLKLGTTDSATIKTDVKIKNVTSKHNSTKEEKSIGNLSSDLPLQGNLTASEFSNLSVVMAGDSHEKQKTSCDISVEEKEIIVASVALDADDKLDPVMSTRNRLKKDLTHNFNVKAKRGDSVEEKHIIVASVARELPKTIEDLKLGTTDSATIKTDVKIKNVTSKHNSTKEEKSIGNLSSDLPLQGNLTASEFSNLSVVMAGDSYEKQKTSCDISVEEKEIIVASVALDADDKLDPVMSTRNRLKKDLTHNFNVKAKRGDSVEEKQIIVASVARELPKTIEDLKLGTTDSATIKTDVKIKNVTSKHNSTKEEKSIGNLSSDLPLQGNLTASEFSNLSVVMAGDSHEKQKTSCDISVEEKEIIVASVALDSDDILDPVMSKSEEGIDGTKSAEVLEKGKKRKRIKQDLTYNFNVKAKRGDSVEEKQIIVASVALDSDDKLVPVMSKSEEGIDGTKSAEVLEKGKKRKRLKKDLTYNFTVKAKRGDSVEEKQIIVASIPLDSDDKRNPAISNSEEGIDCTKSAVVLEKGQKRQRLKKDLTYNFTVKAKQGDSVEEKDIIVASVALDSNNKCDPAISKSEEGIDCTKSAVVLEKGQKRQRLKKDLTYNFTVKAKQGDSVGKKQIIVASVALDSDDKCDPAISKSEDGIGCTKSAIVLEKGQKKKRLKKNLTHNFNVKAKRGDSVEEKQIILASVALDSDDKCDPAISKSEEGIGCTKSAIVLEKGQKKKRLKKNLTHNFTVKAKQGDSVEKKQIIVASVALDSDDKCDPAISKSEDGIGCTKSAILLEKGQKKKRIKKNLTHNFNVTAKRGDSVEEKQIIVASVALDSDDKCDPAISKSEDGIGCTKSAIVLEKGQKKKRLKKNLTHNFNVKAKRGDSVEEKQIIVASVALDSDDKCDPAISKSEEGIGCTKSAIVLEKGQKKKRLKKNLTHNFTVKAKQGDSVEKKQIIVASVALDSDDKCDPAISKSEDGIGCTKSAILLEKGQKKKRIKKNLTHNFNVTAKRGDSVEEKQIIVASVALDSDDKCDPAISESEEGIGCTKSAIVLEKGQKKKRLKKNLTHNFNVKAKRGDSVEEKQIILASVALDSDDKCDPAISKSEDGIGCTKSAIVLEKGQKRKRLKKNLTHNFTVKAKQGDSVEKKQIIVASVALDSDDKCDPAISKSEDGIGCTKSAIVLEKGQKKKRLKKNLTHNFNVKAKQGDSVEEKQIIVASVALDSDDKCDPAISKSEEGIGYTKSAVVLEKGQKMQRLKKELISNIPVRAKRGDAVLNKAGKDDDLAVGQSVSSKITNEDPNSEMSIDTLGYRKSKLNVQAHLTKNDKRDSPRESGTSFFSAGEGLLDLDDLNRPSVAQFMEMGNPKYDVPIIVEDSPTANKNLKSCLLTKRKENVGRSESMAAGGNDSTGAREEDICKPGTSVSGTLDETSRDTSCDILAVGQSVSSKITNEDPNSEMSIDTLGYRKSKLNVQAHLTKNDKRDSPRESGTSFFSAGEGLLDLDDLNRPSVAQFMEMGNPKYDVPIIVEDSPTANKNLKSCLLTKRKENVGGSESMAAGGNDSTGAREEDICKPDTSVSGTLDETSRDTSCDISQQNKKRVTFCLPVKRSMKVKSTVTKEDAILFINVSDSDTSETGSEIEVLNSETSSSNSMDQEQNIESSCRRKRKVCIRKSILTGVCADRKGSVTPNPEEKNVAVISSVLKSATRSGAPNSEIPGSSRMEQEWNIKSSASQRKHTVCISNVCSDIPNPVEKSATSILDTSEIATGSGVINSEVLGNHLMKQERKKGKFISKGKHTACITRPCSDVNGLITSNADERSAAVILNTTKTSTGTGALNSEIPRKSSVEQEQNKNVKSVGKSKQIICIRDSILTNVCAGRNCSFIANRGEESTAVISDTHTSAGNGVLNSEILGSSPVEQEWKMIVNPGGMRESILTEVCYGVITPTPQKMADVISEISAYSPMERKQRSNVKSMFQRKIKRKHSDFFGVCAAPATSNLNEGSGSLGSEISKTRAEEQKLEKSVTLSSLKKEEQTVQKSRFKAIEAGGASSSAAKSEVRIEILASENKPRIRKPRKTTKSMSQSKEKQDHSIVGNVSEDLDQGIGNSVSLKPDDKNEAQNSLLSPFSANAQESGENYGSCCRMFTNAGEGLELKTNDSVTLNTYEGSGNLIHNVAVNKARERKPRKNIESGSQVVAKEVNSIIAGVSANVDSVIGNVISLKSDEKNEVTKSRSLGGSCTSDHEPEITSYKINEKQSINKSDSKFAREGLESHASDSVETNETTGNLICEVSRENQKGWSQRENQPQQEQNVNASNSTPVRAIADLKESVISDFTESSGGLVSEILGGSPRGQKSRKNVSSYTKTTLKQHGSESKAVKRSKSLILNTIAAVIKKPGEGSRYLCSEISGRGRKNWKPRENLKDQGDEIRDSVVVSEVLASPTCDMITSKPNKKSETRILGVLGNGLMEMKTRKNVQSFFQTKEKQDFDVSDSPQVVKYLDLTLDNSVTKDRNIVQSPTISKCSSSGRKPRNNPPFNVSSNGEQGSDVNDSNLAREGGVLDNSTVDLRMSKPAKKSRIPILKTVKRSPERKRRQSVKPIFQIKEREDIPTSDSILEDSASRTLISECLVNNPTQRKRRKTVKTLQTKAKEDITASDSNLTRVVLETRMGHISEPVKRSGSPILETRRTGLKERKRVKSTFQTEEKQGATTSNCNYTQVVLDTRADHTLKTAMKRTFIGNSPIKLKKKNTAKYTSQIVEKQDNIISDSILVQGVFDTNTCSPSTSKQNRGSGGLVSEMLDSSRGQKSKESGKSHLPMKKIPSIDKSESTLASVSGNLGSGVAELVHCKTDSNLHNKAPITSRNQKKRPVTPVPMLPNTTNINASPQGHSHVKKFFKPKSVKKLGTKKLNLDLLHAYSIHTCYVKLKILTPEEIKRNTCLVSPRRNNFDESPERETSMKTLEKVISKKLLTNISGIHEERHIYTESDEEDLIGWESEMAHRITRVHVLKEESDQSTPPETSRTLCDICNCKQI